MVRKALKRSVTNIKHTCLKNRSKGDCTYAIATLVLGATDEIKLL